MNDVVYVQKENLMPECESGGFVFRTGLTNTVDTYIRTKEQIDITKVEGEADEQKFIVKPVCNIALKKDIAPVTYVFIYSYVRDDEGNRTIDESGNFVYAYKGYHKIERTQNPFPIYHIINGTASDVTFYNTTTQANEVVTVTDVAYIQLSLYTTYAIYEDYNARGLDWGVMVWESDKVEKYCTEWLNIGEQPHTYYYKDKQMLSKAQRDDVLLARDKARFDNSFNYIAYSNVTGSGYSINSTEHFTWAAKQGFTALKGDVRPTSDGELIMCHDEGFTLTDDKIVNYDETAQTLIHDLTKAQCLALQHRATGHSVCDFDTYIKICKKYGKIAFITIRDEYIEDIVVPKMLETLDKYNMRKNCIVNSFTYTTLKTVRAFDDNIMLSQVLTSSATLNTAYITNAINLGVCLICGVEASKDNTYELLASETVQEAIALARANDIRLYEALVDSMNDIDLLMKYGIVGAQMTFIPNFE